MNQPLLSIVVPVCNGAGVIRRCIASLLRQTWKNCEVICVDDGSTDGTDALLDEYAARDNRVKVIHQQNAGVSVARNRGLDAASGEYVTFVDADDWVAPETYETALSVFRNKNINCVCFGTVVEGEAPARLEEYCNLIPEGEIEVTPGLVSCMNASIWNKIYRLELIRSQAVRFPTGVAYGEDAAFFYCYAALGGYIYGLSHKFYHYVQHTGSAMANPHMVERRVTDLLHAFDYVCAFYTWKGILSRWLPVLESVFCGFCRIAKETGMFSQVQSAAVESARRSGVLRSCCEPCVQELKMLSLSPWERCFHWYTQNRECYGIAGFSLFSITYVSGKMIFRILGRRVFECQKGDTA